MREARSKLIVVLGPTAAGKTKLAVSLARKFGGEIISADSRQVYKGMDLGTGKDLAEYGLQGPNLAENKASGKASGGSRKPPGVRYHLIDIIGPKTPFNVAKYQKLAKRAIQDIESRNKLPFIAGGTGLYIDAVAKGFEFPEITEARAKKLGLIRKKLNKLSLDKLLAKLKKIDPASYDKIDRKNRRRVQRALEIFYESGKTKSATDKQTPPDHDILILGVKFPLAELYRRIDARLEDRIREGMVAEVKKLRKSGVSWKRLEEFGLEYRYVTRFLRGLITEKEMEEQLKSAIHHFAKRQLTWFKRDKSIVWVKDAKQAEKIVAAFLRKKSHKKRPA